MRYWVEWSYSVHVPNCEGQLDFARRHSSFLYEASKPDVEFAIKDALKKQYPDNRVYNLQIKTTEV